MELNKKIFVLSLMSYLLFIPIMHYADNQIVDPLFPDVQVDPLEPGGYPDSRETQGTEVEKKEKKKAEKKPVKTKDDTPKKKKISKRKFDADFFNKDIILKQQNHIRPNDDDEVNNTFFSEILGSCSGTILYGRD